ncbi:MAG: SH3 domain-containing protein [Butyricicoccus sp.]
MTYTKQIKRFMSLAAAVSIVCTSAFAAGSGVPSGTRTAQGNDMVGVCETPVSKTAVRETPISKTVRTKTALYVRAGAGTTYEVIGALEKGTEVTVVADAAGWYKIPYGKGYGYIGGNLTEDVTKTVQKKVKVTAAGLNVRADATVKSTAIGRLKKGDVIKVVDSKPGWYQIEYGNGYGYISMQYVRDTYKKRTVTSNKVSVRSGAGLRYSVLGTLRKGAVVTVVETDGNWYKIKYGSGYGYILSKCTKK